MALSARPDHRVRREPLALLVPQVQLAPRGRMVLMARPDRRGWRDREVRLARRAHKDLSDLRVRPEPQARTVLTAPSVRKVSRDQQVQLVRPARMELMERRAPKDPSDLRV